MAISAFHAMLVVLCYFDFEKTYDAKSNEDNVDILVYMDIIACSVAKTP